MRRFIGVLPAGALAAALCCGMVRANLMPIAVPHIDLSASVFASVFSEQNGHRDAFQPLAFHVALSDAVASLPDSELHVSAPSFSDGSFGQPDVKALPVPRAQTSFMPNAGAAPSLVTNFVPPAPQQLGIAHDGNALGFAIPVEHRFKLSSYTPVETQTFSLPQQSSAVAIPLHIGHVDVVSHAAATQLLASNASSSFNDNALNAGATFNVHAGKRNFGLDVSSTSEHLDLNSTPNVSLAGDDAQLFVPSFADISRRTLGTALTVPLSRSLTGSVQFDTEHLLGSYGAPGASNLDASNTVVGAGLTYQLPKRANEAITLSAKQFHYQDNLVPTNTFVQTSANVDFTVKF